MRSNDLRISCRPSSGTLRWTGLSSACEEDRDLLQSATGAFREAPWGGDDDQVVVVREYLRHDGRIDLQRLGDISETLGEAAEIARSSRLVSRGITVVPISAVVLFAAKRAIHLGERLMAEALLAFQKKVSELLQIPLKPFESDEDD